MYYWGRCTTCVLGWLLGLVQLARVSLSFSLSIAALFCGRAWRTRAEFAPVRELLAPAPSRSAKPVQTERPSATYIPSYRLHAYIYIVHLSEPNLTYRPELPHRTGSAVSMQKTGARQRRALSFSAASRCLNEAQGGTRLPPLVRLMSLPACASRAGSEHRRESDRSDRRPYWHGGVIRQKQL